MGYGMVGRREVGFPLGERYGWVGRRASLLLLMLLVCTACSVPTQRTHRAVGPASNEPGSLAPATLVGASVAHRQLVPSAKRAPDDVRPCRGEGARHPPKLSLSPTSVVIPGSLTKTPPHHARVAGPHPKTVASAITAFGAANQLATKIQQVQRDAGDAFAIRRDSPGAPRRARNHRHDLQATFADDAVELRSLGARSATGSRWSTEIRLVGVRRGVESVPLAEPQVVASANRVEYRRGSLLEWYVNGPLGLEQGFTFAERPVGAGREVAVSLAFRGNVRARAADGGDALALEVAGRPSLLALRVSQLHVLDAAGRALPARMSVQPDGFEIRFDDSHAAYPVVVDPLYGLEQELVAGDAVLGGYGTVVALRDGLALVSAPRHDPNQTGAVLQFTLGSGFWSHLETLTASDAAERDNFGAALALTDDTALIGSPNDSDLGSRAGAVYVFTRTDTELTEVQKLTAADAMSSDLFGSAVAIDGTTAVIGAKGADGINAAAGAAYVFVEGATWTEQAKLTASDGATNDLFARSLSVSGDTVVIGAAQDDDGGIDSGSAYVFTRAGTTWTQETKLAATDAGAGQWFGYSVAAAGGTLVVGAPYATFASAPTAGAVYVFVGSGATWVEEAILRPGDGEVGDHFGASVAILGDLVLVGAPGDDDRGADSGSVYAYERTGSSWTRVAKLPTAPGNEDAAYGVAVALDATHAVVGAPGQEPGAAYAYELVSTLDDGISCTYAGECSSGSCVQGVCCDTPCDGGCVACTAELKESGADDGVCGPVAAGTDPLDDCTDDGASACLLNGLCDGVGACQTYPESIDCTPRSCSANAECTSGFCVDGVCCETACLGECEACTSALKGSGHDGVCGPIAAGTDPEEECPADEDYPENCGRDGTCSGSAQCRRYAVEATICGSPQCGDVGVEELLCNAVGQCVATPTAECGVYPCVDGACASACSDDTECSMVAYCADQRCVADLDPGSGCERDEQCLHGFCVDGYCCDQACNGQCEACDVEDSEGTCLAVTGAPHGSRGVCDAGGPECAGSCDGEQRASCQYPGEELSCGVGSCASMQTTPRVCDGAGACIDGPLIDCSPYACAADGQQCAEACESDAACASGFRCNGDGACEAWTTTCADAVTLEHVDGSRTSCEPYTCENDACRQLCDQSAHCAPGYECQGSSCVVEMEVGTGGGGGAAGGPSEPPEEPASDDGGCGCRLAPSVPAPRDWSSLLLALALVALGWRRRC